jgi:tetratricopeptide (TPR) repeat protein
MTENFDTFLNKAWDYTIGKIPEKIIYGTLALSSAIAICAVEIPRQLEKRADEAIIAERVAENARRNELASREDSLLNYGLRLVQKGELDRAEIALAKADAVRPNYVIRNDLERAIKHARNDIRLLPLRLEFTNNQYTATEDAQTLWEIAPKYWEALNGKTPSSKDEESVYVLWSDMVKHRKSLGKSIDSINVGEKVELPEKGLSDIMSRYYIK